MWPGAYWLKSSSPDDSLTDIVYGGGGEGQGKGGEGGLRDVAGGELFDLPGLYLKLK